MDKFNRIQIAIKSGFKPSQILDKFRVSDPDCILQPTDIRNKKGELQAERLQITPPIQALVLALEEQILVPRP